MRVYYHTCPTCPQCHEPHTGGAILEIKEDCIRCPSCGAHFYKSVDLVTSGKFPRTVERLCNTERYDVIKYLKNLPLVWRIDLNTIEREYVSWIAQAEKGAYLITWPWSEVRFVPLLVSEFLITRPESRAVIVGDVSNEENNRLIEFPAVDVVFRNLVFVESPTADFEDLKTEINRFDRKMIFKKINVINCTVVEGKSRREFICTETIGRCKKSIIEELEEIFGRDALRTVKWKKLNDQKWRTKNLNENGFVDIVLEERQQYPAKKLRYRSQWLWEVLLNSKKIKRPSRIIKHKVIRSEDDLKENLSSTRLFFISGEIHPGNIFSMIGSINPDLVVIQNVDDFIRDIIIYGTRSMKFIDFLNELPESIVLMFSTNPEVRYLYGINYPNEFSILDLGVVPHTWDCEPIIEKLRAFGTGDNTGAYPSPLSSRIEDLPHHRDLPEVEFVELEEITRLEKAVSEIEKIFQGEMGRDMLKFLQDMLRSPVHPSNLRRKGKLTGHNLTLDYVVAQIYNTCGEEKAGKISSIIKAVYGGSEACGPIMKMILEKANEILERRDCIIVAVVHSYDVRTTKKILENQINENSERVEICSWTDLRRILRSKSSGEICLISTVIPSYLSTLTGPRIFKIIFIGGRKFIETVSKVVKNRFDENMRRPIYILENEPAPVLLKEIQKELDLSSNQEILNLTEEFMFELDSDVQAVSPHYGCQSYSLTLEPGKRALLVVDFDGRGVFIPLNSSLLVVSGNELAEIDTGDIVKKGRTTLTGKELLLDRQGLYSSFRADFIRLMIEHGERAVFKRGPYVWNGFDELLEDAVQWILLLEKAIEYYAERMKIHPEEAERKISEYLASLDLTAKDPDYIKKWWNDFEIVFTRKGPVRVFRIEHPRSPKDLEKIYAGLGELIPDLETDLEAARRCYAASITIQSFRRLLVKGKIKDVSPTLRILYRKVEREIRRLVENSEKFRVNLVYNVEITKEVHPYRVLENFKEYCKIIA